MHIAISRTKKKSAVTRIRTWVSSATTRGTNHYTITAIGPLLRREGKKIKLFENVNVTFSFRKMSRSSRLARNSFERHLFSAPLSVFFLHECKISLIFVAFIPIDLEIVVKFFKFHKFKNHNGRKRQDGNHERFRF